MYLPGHMMKSAAIITMVSLCCLLPLTVNASQTRCGWLHNPSPANIWLSDADGDWTISLQGGEPILKNDDDFDNLPVPRETNYVRTNGAYGYSCACLEVDVNTRQNKITAIYRSQSLELKQCLEDPAIAWKIPVSHPEPEEQN